jgi:hypothetical protein
VQYQERITKDRLYNEYIPKNLEDALLQLEKLMTPESKVIMKDIPEDQVCRQLHGRLGQWIINNWGFYGGSRLSHYLRSAGITYPDDMADFLILAYHKRLNDKPVQVKEMAIEFKEMRKKAWRSKNNAKSSTRKHAKKTKSEPFRTSTCSPALNHFS